MPLDQAILAARDREAPPPHRLHLAVAHAGEVSAHYIGGRLKHPFLLCERLRIEACAPWPTAIGINRDRRVHAAHFDAQVGGRGFDQGGDALGESEMHGRFRLSIDPGMTRSDESREWKEGVRTCEYRWSPYP